MNNDIALKAIQILAEESDIDLNEVLADIANNFSTIAVLNAVSRATTEAVSADEGGAVDPYGFNEAQRNLIAIEVENRGKVKGILLAREIHENALRYRLGLREAKNYIEEHYADAVDTYVENHPNLYTRSH